MAKPLLLAPRHPASTVRVVTFGVATSPTSRNSAETTSFSATTRPASPRPPANAERAVTYESKRWPKLLLFAPQHAREGRHLCIEIVPKPHRERRSGSAMVAPGWHQGSARVRHGSLDCPPLRLKINKISKECYVCYVILTLLLLYNATTTSVVKPFTTLSGKRPVLFFQLVALLDLVANGQKGHVATTAA